jgi:hypothetical protein
MVVVSLVLVDIRKMIEKRWVGFYFFFIFLMTAEEHLKCNCVRVLYTCNAALSLFV